MSRNAVYGGRLPSQISTSAAVIAAAIAAGRPSRIYGRTGTRFRRAAFAAYA